MEGGAFKSGEGIDRLSYCVVFDGCGNGEYIFRVQVGNCAMRGVCRPVKMIVPKGRRRMRQSNARNPILFSGKRLDVQVSKYGTIKAPVLGKLN